MHGVFPENGILVLLCQNLILFKHLDCSLLGQKSHIHDYTKLNNSSFANIV